MIIFQISVESIQADNITFPFFFTVNTLKFDAGGVAMVSYNASNTTSWYIHCWPKEVSRLNIHSTHNYISIYKRVKFAIDVIYTLDFGKLATYSTSHTIMILLLYQF